MKATQSAFDGEVPEHPDLSALFKLILQAEPVFIANGKNAGNPYVIVSEAAGAMFTFTKTADGYLLTRNK